jgi:hypothetical protein
VRQNSPGEPPSPETVAACDVAVVGGGPAGISAAVAAARMGAEVVLLERYPYLGGLASGGLVLLLDDMTHQQELTVRGIAQEFIEHLAAMGLVVFPPPEDRNATQESIERWRRWSFIDRFSRDDPQPVTFAASFDPEGWKLVANRMVLESGVHLRLNSWFLYPELDGRVVTAVVCATKSGLQRIEARVTVDASGDADVACGAGAPTISGSYLMSLTFRLGGVDTRAAERFEREHPAEAALLNRAVRDLLGGSWGRWWDRSSIDGVVWCNCPHFSGLVGTDVGDLTKVEVEGRERIWAAFEYAKSHVPGFERAFVLGVATQVGVRQSRLLAGEYVVTSEDIKQGRHFADSVARGRNYYTPYRALLPTGIEGLLVAGRHYSAEPTAQRISREIPPCMAMGQAAGIAAALAAAKGVGPRHVDISSIQSALEGQGADPGRVPPVNAADSSVLAGDHLDPAAAGLA